MWIAKFDLVHDCIFLNRCKKFGVDLQSVPLSVFKIGTKIGTSSIHYASGNTEDIDKFVKDLKKEKGIIKIERKRDTFFVIEKTETQSIRFHTPKILFLKPVLISKRGVEAWEVASWEKRELNKFIENVGKNVSKINIVKIIKKNVDDVFYPRLMPQLTKNQKRALELAIENGYYDVPKRIDLRRLAKGMGISLSTFQTHLRKAEKKLILNSLYLEK